MRRGLLLALLVVLLLAQAARADFEAHFIYVGQAESILLRCDGQTMLIDAGLADRSDALVSYLRDAGVTRLDYALCTHAHADHIGGMPAVIEAFPVGALWTQSIDETEKRVKAVLEAAAGRAAPVLVPTPGVRGTLGGATFEVLAANGDTNPAMRNDASVVLRVTYGANTFLFMGDLEATGEARLMQSGFALDADLLKVGHHGRDTSTTTALLEAVTPKYAVICCGDVGPSPEVLGRLADCGAAVLRTDRMGTVVAESDGASIRLREVFTLFDVRADRESALAGEAVTWRVSASDEADYAFELLRDGQPVEARDAVTDGGAFCCTISEAGSYSVRVRAVSMDGEEAACESDAVRVTSEMALMGVVCERERSSAGQTLRWSADVSGGFGALSYWYEVFQGDQIVWHSERFEASANMEYVPTAVGWYAARVYVADERGTVLTATSENVYVDEALAIRVEADRAVCAVGETIRWKATAEGGIGAHRYYFDVLLDGERVAGDDAYHPADEYAYAPTEPGVYTVRAYVRDELSDRAVVVSGEVTVSAAP